ARVTEQLSRMEHDAGRHPVGGPRPSRDRPVLRGLLGIFLAGGIGAAAFAAQSPSGEGVRPPIAQWAPNLLPASTPSLARPANPAPGPAGVQLAAVDAVPVLPTASAQTPGQDAASAPAPMSPELTQMLQAMARDIATVEQGIEELKASQARM